jgi:hypothetical protein
MSLGLAGRQGNLLDDVDRFLDEALDATSIYVFFHRERDALFPDEDFADLFDRKGRNSVPPSVVSGCTSIRNVSLANLQRGRGCALRIHPAGPQSTTTKHRASHLP